MDWLDTLWVISYLVVVLGLSGYGIHRYVMIYLFCKHAKDVPKPDAHFDELPMVTVQLPIYNELHVVERLVRSVAELDYPKDKLQIQVLDDSTDETREICQVEVAKLVAAGFNAQLIHRVDRTGFKAGALEHGMPDAIGEYIFILDADFVPPKNVLHDMIHYFTDEKIGLIQTRWGHINREYSLLTRIQAMFLDGHLIVEQTARSRSGRFFNFNGTAGIWRKSCIEDAGGWQHDTLTEDLDLSYRAQMKGWKFVFLKDVVTPAELPVDMNGFKSQQHRWTKGSIQTCKKLLKTVWMSPQPLIIKLEATAHLTSNFAYLLLIFLCFLIYPGASPDGLELGGYRFFILDLPVFMIASVSVGAFYICSQRAVYPKNWMKEVLLLPFLLALGIGMSINNGKAVLEALFNMESPFVRTPKYGILRNGQSWRRSSYSAMKSLALVFELILALYFSYLTLFSIAADIWSSVPFMMLFTFGFWYVAIGSLMQLIPPSWLSSNKPIAEAVATVV
jgi:cellulose synthase/poly-beta-1,6-N-acetylglucosamine synthase-like glycosyltransferase